MLTVNYYHEQKEVDENSNKYATFVQGDTPGSCMMEMEAPDAEEMLHLVIRTAKVMLEEIRKEKVKGLFAGYTGQK